MTHIMSCSVSMTVHDSQSSDMTDIIEYYNWLLYIVMDTLVHAQHCNSIYTGPYGPVMIT